MRSRTALALTVLALTVTLAGCGKTVPGTALPAGGTAGTGGTTRINTNFDKLLRECTVVAIDDIGKSVGDNMYVEPSFNGAVCMWNLTGGAAGSGMVTLSWYEEGSLGNEKQNNDRLKYVSNDITVQGRRSVETRRPNDPDSCGVSAPAADAGIVGWWVNYRSGSAHADPCDAARKLVELTLNLAR
ncbi:DUF3558 domain-containing protein [Nocardia seriolae]|uniref:DUF3558 domain-containing protein n=4 Tax=Nocardia seriolae TaxID=37332 RepID=A0ABC9Z1R9_9NOCA|nr:DUF3558 domain-containing protein [Nocardia seriolae]APB01864.1 hypothetical protein NS506_07849 [Nocardia seriolae]WKY52002.1 DUF3558 domain-containing protein [Nocardia seriolae]BEK91455.1 DUF3558 domain-containing protein [Nocardia seriolae]BEK92844.1 DUF3558 domain-containing protein [Nocardia seriolae]GAM49777.1 hypothetical protein NS07_v2contig00122-0015 [Nocardia seriolae]